MPTLAMVHVDDDYESVKNVGEQQLSSDGDKNETTILPTATTTAAPHKRRITPKEESAQKKKKKKPKKSDKNQMTLGAFFKGGAATKARAPTATKAPADHDTLETPYETPALDPARKMGLLSIVMGTAAVTPSVNLASKFGTPAEEEQSVATSLSVDKTTDDDDDADKKPTDAEQKPSEEPSGKAQSVKTVEESVEMDKKESARSETETPTETNAEEPSKTIPKEPSEASTEDPSKTIAEKPSLPTAAAKRSETPTPEISTATSEWQSKAQSMHATYLKKGQELLQHCLDQLAQEERPALPPVNETPTSPDDVVPLLSTLIEGSSASLSELVATAASLLPNVPTDALTHKIKLLATRKQLVKNPRLLVPTTTPVLDVFEDTQPAYLWRWQVVDRSPVWRKRSAFLNAIGKLLHSLQQQPVTDKIRARVSQEEARVLNYIREDNKKAADSAQAKRQQKKEQAAAERQQKKEQAAAERQRAKEEKAARKQLEKQAKEQEAEKERLKKKAVLEKQQKAMMCFFTAAPALKSQTPKPTTPVPKPVVPIVAPNTTPASNFDADRFRSSINTAPAPTRMPCRRRGVRRVRHVTVPVFVTVFPDNPFEQQPWAEQKDVVIRNRYKFFHFHEDVRPPYHGTWSKQSSVVTGRTPFEKDLQFLDYDHDSEAEWDPEDNEVGEDIEGNDDEKSVEDEEKSMNSDGWLAADDEMEDDLDEETKAMRRKQLESGSGDTIKELTVCIVAPNQGAPMDFLGLEETPLVEGFNLEEAQAATAKLAAYDNHSDEVAVYLDAFPPALVDESEPESSNTKQQVMTDEDKKAFCKIVHNSTITSKDKLLDAVQAALPETTKNRAQTARFLDATAKKSGTTSVRWHIKQEVLESLGLEDLETIDASAGREDQLRCMARAVHHSRTASKEKAAEEVRREHLPSSSKAECVRLMDEVAEKKKHPVSGVYWQVKVDVRDKLGLTELPNEPPTVELNVESAKKRKSPETVAAAPSAKKSKPQSPKKTPPAPQNKATLPAGSATLLASFLKNAKK